MKSSLRRKYLDHLLFQNVDKMKKRVLDVGGKKDAKRGEFRPPISAVESWEYLNIDESTNPDYLGSAENIPAGDNAFDTVLLCEVVEHLKNPQIVLRDIRRVLRSSGTLILSVPFLLSIHGDPFDYQRWTGIKLREELEDAGFSRVEIYPMGGVFAVIHDLLRVWILRSNDGASVFWKFGFVFIRLLFPILSLLDVRTSSSAKYITTGYFAIAS